MEPTEVLVLCGVAHPPGSSDEAEDLHDLTCPICMSLLQQPRVLPLCSTPHRYCAACIGLWLSGQARRGLRRTCPIDRRALGPDEHPTPDAHSARLLARCLISCPNAGCTDRVPAATLWTHAATCELRATECHLCSASVPLKSLEAHERRCGAVCADCGAPVPRRDAGTHQLLWCLARDHGSWRTEAEAASFREAKNDVLQWEAAHVEACCDWNAVRVALAGLARHMGVLSSSEADADAWVAALGAGARELQEAQWRPALALAVAEKALEEAVSAQPLLAARVHAHAGSAALALARPTTALRHFEACLALAPRTLPALAGRAAALQALGDPLLYADAQGLALCEARAIGTLRRVRSGRSEDSPESSALASLALSWPPWAWVQ
ncbi:hypothetical protein T492DRAFT_895161, partial [Pavlovales sp. CCMP2436]